MKLAVIGPVLNEVDFIGFSIMACLDQMHEFIYALDEKSEDGTRELLHYIKDKYAKEKLVILDQPTFHPSDMKAYNDAFNVCIERSTADYVTFLHPDMIIINPRQILRLKDGPLAYTVHMTSFARDFRTVITKGRADQWKNIHAKKFGLHYFGGYGSVNEDFYHSDITGKSYRHFSTDFQRYPFEVADSGINVNHYCELKAYGRRLEKMKLCLKTQNPDFDQARIDEMAVNHPRVSLEMSSLQFGKFEFEEMNVKVPEVFEKYKTEFDQFKKEPILV